DPFPPHLAERARMVGVVAHQRRHIEGGREPRLAVLEQVAEALVRLLGRAEAGELAHRPELASVHRRVDAARIGIDAGIPEIAVVVDLDVLGRVERVVRKPRDSGVQLAHALRSRLEELAAPLLGSAFEPWFVPHNTTSQAEKEVAARAGFVTRVLLQENDLRRSDFQRVVSRTRRAQLDALFRRAGALDGFLRANLMSRAGLVTYSTYHPLMGMPLAQRSAAYEDALSGEGVHTNGRLRDRFGRETGKKILRSDLPIRAEGAPPFGVIEIAQDYGVVTRSAHQTLYPVAGFLL